MYIYTIIKNIILLFPPHENLKYWLNTKYQLIMKEEKIYQIAAVVKTCLDYFVRLHLWAIYKKSAPE